MFCPNCGNEINGNPKFCENCGHKLEHIKDSIYNNSYYKESYKKKKEKNTNFSFGDSFVKGVITMLVVIFGFFAFCIIKNYFVDNVFNLDKSKYQQYVENPSLIPEFSQPESLNDLVKNLHNIQTFLALYLKSSDDSMDIKIETFNKYRKELLKLQNFDNTNLLRESAKFQVPKEEKDFKKIQKEYKKMLSSAYVKVQVLSKKMPEGLLDKFSSAFSKINRSETKINPSVAKKHEKVNEYNETAKINQAKLALGLTRKSTDDKLVHLVLSDIFGGGPYSKLFSNVREKLSLCYYCACRSYRNKGLLMVDSGVEKDNLVKAKASILKEFEDIKNGEFSEELVETSKTSIIDTLLSTEDFETAVDSFYAVRTNNHLKSIKDAIKEIEAVTKEDIINAANEYTLDTVFTLLPEGQDEANN